MEIKGLQKRRASEGYTEQAAQTLQEIKALIDEVAIQSSLDEVTRKIASISASAFRKLMDKESPQCGRISVFTCRNLSRYSGIPFEVFCGRQPFTEEYKNRMKDSLRRDFPLNNFVVEEKSSPVKFPRKKEMSYENFLDNNIKELLDYLADLIALKIYKKLQNNKS
jgi:hypothetical protein